MVKQLSKEHRKHLSDSIKKWWKLNKENNPEFLKRRNEKLSNTLKGRPQPNKSIRTGKVIKCRVCNKKFYVEPTRLRRGNPQFCSRKCMTTFLRNGKWHILHPKANWYHRTMVKTIGKCELCGFSDSRILMVHHINRNRKDNRRENLLVVCPNCHLLAHVDDKWFKRKWALICRAWIAQFEKNRLN